MIPQKISNTVPQNNQQTRDALYQGQIFQIAPTSASLKIVHIIQGRLQDYFGNHPRLAQQELPEKVFFEKMGALRKELYTEAKYHRLIRECIASLGFDNQEVAFDPLRLRVINHNGHHNPLAAPVYYPHRDTWYGHPPSLITWWIPLDDLTKEETFEFYPERFDQPIPNSSEIFDYDEWISKGWDLKIGWQRVSEQDRLQYPSVLGEPNRGAVMEFSCQKGENLLFAGAHFHATKPQSFYRTRFSLDFRIVDLRDFRNGKGAPSVDDHSTGTAISDYIQPGQSTWSHSQLLNSPIS